MEMQRLQPIVPKDLIEDVREGGNQPCNDAAHEEGEEGASLGFWHVKAGPELSLPPLVAFPHRQQALGGVG